MSFAFRNDDKFAIVAVEDADTDFPTVPFEKNLGNNIGDIWAFSKMPAEIDETWKKWIGSNDAESLSKCNLVLLCKCTSQKPEGLDKENNELGRVVSQLFYQLQLTGVVEYSQAFYLTGSYHRSEFSVRQFAEMPKFLMSEGIESIPVDDLRLDKAKRHTDILSRLYGSTMYVRFKKGWRVFMEGLKQNIPEERLHQFARSLEALIHPREGRTKRDFKHRCQILSISDVRHSEIFDEVFELRSMAEHLNNWEPVLAAYPKQKRNDVAMLRIRQMELFASFAYTAVFDNKSLLRIFATDLKLKKFWSLNDTQKKAKWGTKIDLTTIV